MARVRKEYHVVGGLYGANTLGAVVGSLAATFWITPAFGFSQSQHLLAALNGICALCVFSF